MSVMYRQSFLIPFDQSVSVKNCADMASKLALNGINPIVVCSGDKASELIYELIERQGYLMSKQIATDLVLNNIATSIKPYKMQNDRKFFVIDADKGHPLLAKESNLPYIGIIRAKGSDDTEKLQNWFLKNKNIKYI